MEENFLIHRLADINKFLDISDEEKDQVSPYSSGSMQLGEECICQKISIDNQLAVEVRDMYGHYYE